MTTFHWVELKVVWVSPIYFKTIHLTALIVLCETLCFHWGLYCHKVSHHLVPKSCLSGQSECHSFSRRKSSPLCVCEDQKKKKKKPTVVPLRIDMMVTCRIALRAARPPWQAFCLGQLREDEKHESVWWTDLSNTSNWDGHDDWYWHGGTINPTENLQTRHKGWTSTN